MLVLDDMIVMFSSVVSSFSNIFYFDMVYKYKKCLYYAHGLCVGTVPVIWGILHSKASGYIKMVKASFINKK